MNRRDGNERRRARQDLETTVAEKQARKIRARKEGENSAWFGLGMFGLVGWSVAIPTLLGVAIGSWIDARWPSRFSWTLMLMVLGVAVGCLNAWRWVRVESQEHENDTE